MCYYNIVRFNTFKPCELKQIQYQLFQKNRSSVKLLLFFYVMLSWNYIIITAINKHWCYPFSLAYYSPRYVRNYGEKQTYANVTDMLTFRTHSHIFSCAHDYLPFFRRRSTPLFSKIIRCFIYRL